MKRFRFGCSWVWANRLAHSLGYSLVTQLGFRIRVAVAFWVWLRARCRFRAAVGFRVLVTVRLKVCVAVKLKVWLTFRVRIEDCQVYFLGYCWVQGLGDS